MIKNDLRYIIKKIIIGIGIFIGIFYFKSCYTYALEDTSNMVQISDYTFGSFSRTRLYYDNSTQRIYHLKNYGTNLSQSNSQFINVPDGYNYIGFWNTSSVFLISGDIYAEESGNNYVFYCSSTCRRTVYYLDTGSSSTLNSFNQTSNYSSGQQINLSGVKTGNWISSQDIYNQDKSIKYINKFFTIGVQIPEIISLNATLNKTDDNMLVSVSFSPEFSFIDTDNYNYYVWFDGKERFNILENNVNFNTQSNTTFFVEITDKDNNYITSESYTVSSIGLVYNGDYDIQFNTNEFSNSDTENNTDEIFDIINRIDIDILYIPKWVNYKYQYQFVPENESLTDNWLLVNDNNDKNNIVYTTNSNGTMYARILDDNNNVLKTETFTITRIGQLKIYDKNTDKFYGMFNIIKEKLNFGGPISDLIVLPVNVVQSIANASNKVCVPYDLGSIAGHHIVLPCIEPEHYLGSALWTTIDLIFSGCMFYAISKWFTSAYYKFILLDNTPGIKDRRDME